MKLIIKKTVFLILTSLILFFTTSCGKTTQTVRTITGTKNKETLVPISFNTDTFAGKKVVAYGDSITYGATVTDINKNLWVNVLKSELHFTCTNFAINGALLSYTTTLTIDRDSMCTEIVNNEEANSIADFAFIFIGTNDFARNVQIGNNFDKAYKLSDVSTFKQGIFFAVDTLKRHNKNIKIVFILPINRYDRSMSRGDGKTLEDFRLAIEELHSECGYYYIDTRTVFNSDNFNVNTTYSNDALHPNDEGQKYLANYLLNQEIVG